MNERVRSETTQEAPEHRPAAPAPSRDPPVSQLPASSLQSTVGNQAVNRLIQPERPPAQRRFTQNANQLTSQALPRFQSAVDRVSEDEILAAGLFVLNTWHELQTSYRKLGGDARAPGSVKQRWTRLQRSVRVNLSTQCFKTRAVLGSYRVPPDSGEVGAFIAHETRNVGWVARDTDHLVRLLGSDDPLPEAGQWQAIGLLRQHQNPWHFAYMLAVVRDRGLGDRLSRFAPGPARFLRLVREGQREIREQQLIGPSGRLGAVRYLPFESKVVLLRPLTAREIAEQFYGRADRWRTHVVPFNRAVTGGSAHRLLPVGTEIVLAAELLTLEYRRIFVYARRMRQRMEESGSEPYIYADPASTAVVGNRVRYSIVWPGSMFENAVRVKWRIELDPIGEPEQGLHPTVYSRRGWLRREAESTNTTIEPPLDDAGNYRIRCRLQTRDGRIREVTYTQVVMTLEQRTELTLEHSRPIPFARTVLERLREQRRQIADAETGEPEMDDLDEERQPRPTGPSIQEELQGLDDQIGQVQRQIDWEFSGSEQQQALRREHVELQRQRAEVVARRGETAEQLQQLQALDLHFAEVEEFFRDRGRASVSPIRSVYASATDEPLAMQLLTYVGLDPAYLATDPGWHLVLWDMTPPEPAEYHAEGERLQQALYNLLREFALASPYPRGQIRFEIRVGMPFLGVTESIVAYPTNGGIAASDILQWASTAFLVTGLGLAAVLHPLAIPVLLVSGVLAGAAGGAEIAEDLERGTFDWDTQTVLNVMDVVSALLACSIATRAVRGMASLTVIANSVDIGQIAVVGTVHAEQIRRAVATGNREEIRQAVEAAVRDAALMVIQDRVTARAGDRRARRARTRDANAMIGDGGRGGSAPGDPTARQLSAAAEARSNAYREFHERQLEELGLSSTTPERVGPSEGADVGALEQRAAFYAYDQLSGAYGHYEQALVRFPGREVAIYRNADNGDYAVRLGGRMSVRPPPGNWEGVLHFHPIPPENALVLRNPSADDIGISRRRAELAGRVQTEMIEYGLPGGMRARTRYRVESSGRITIEYSRPDGQPDRTQYPDLADYRERVLNRKIYLDPEGPIASLLGHQAGAEGHSMIGEGDSSRFHEIDLQPPADAGTINIYGGSRPGDRIPGVRRRAEQPTHGEPSTEPGGTEARAGRYYREFTPAEVARSLRIDWDPVAGRPRTVVYHVNAEQTLASGQETTRRFRTDETFEGAQSRRTAYVGSGWDIGHLAQREAFRELGGEVELAADYWANTVPMAREFNQRGDWRRAERETMHLAEQYGEVEVEISVHYDQTPECLSDGTPIPSYFVRTVRLMDGQMLHTEPFINAD